MAYETRRKWRAIIHRDNERVYLGHYDTKQEAEQRECLEYDRYIAEEFYDTINV